MPVCRRCFGPYPTLVLQHYKYPSVVAAFFQTFFALLALLALFALVALVALLASIACVASVAYGLIAVRFGFLGASASLRFLRCDLGLNLHQCGGSPYAVVGRAGC